MNGSTWIALAALIVALVGGIPGFFQIRDFLSKGFLKIRFDENNSVACRIDSSDERLGDKMAILFYRVTITGGSKKPAHISDFNLAIKVNGKWITGKRFFPKQHEVTDSNGMTKLSVTLRQERTTGTYIIHLASWQEFKPGQKRIEYGDPITFSFASYFDVDIEAFQNAKFLRITISDYLGNDYKETVSTSTFFWETGPVSLLQD